MKTKSIVLIFVLFIAIQSFAQKSKHHKISYDFTQDSIAKSLAPIEGMALVYIIRPTSYGALIRMKIDCDSLRMGTTKAKEYIYAMLSPGTHTFTSISENRSTLDVTLEAGKIYYIKEKVKMGFAFARTGLEILTDDDGHKFLENSRLSDDNAYSKNNGQLQVVQ